ncbi:MAG: DUF1638 domain-containing protein [Chloroflexota bacterium]|nr:MAG: DUF1638 domain-containing protein [Chloroflexota bacterium]
MDPIRTTIIACATVIEEVMPYLPAGMVTQVLDFGLHLSPGKLKNKLQEAVDSCGPEFENILLGYGLCSMAVVGLKSSHSTLVIPRVDDCIAIFLGSRQAYSEQSRKEPGTYYLTKGWIEVADTPFDEYERLVERYGVERADWIMHAMLKNYTRLVYIDTGHTDKSPYVTYARKTADKFHLRFEEVPGSNALVLKMLTGPWDNDFLVVEPGRTITYLDFRASETGVNKEIDPKA